MSFRLLHHFGTIADVGTQYYEQGSNEQRQKSLLFLALIVNIFIYTTQKQNIFSPHKLPQETSHLLYSVSYSII